MSTRRLALNCGKVSLVDSGGGLTAMWPVDEGMTKMPTRREVLAGTVLATAAIATTGMHVSAQDGDAGAEVGFAIARVRTVATPELAQAVSADALANFLPENRSIEGYRGYVLAFVSSDPASMITLSLLADETAADASAVVSKEYVAGLDPRFEAQLAAEFAGPMRVWAVTERTRAELPPNLSGCAFTVRDRTNSEGADVERIFSLVQEQLLPQLVVMEGFILYGFFQTEIGRTGISIWETEEEMQAGNDLIAAFAQETQEGTWVGEPSVYDGRIDYAEIPGIAD